MMKSTHYSNAGFSMIEVLVSLIITVIGVLGMVALQSKAIPYTQDSVQRNTAIMLVDDLVEIIRSAPADCTTTNSCLKAPSASFPAVPSSCTPTPTSLADQIGCWTARANTALPGGLVNTANFYICKSASPGVVTSCTTSSTSNAELEIQVAWTVNSAANCMSSADSTASGSTVCTYRLRTRIK